MALLLFIGGIISVVALHFALTAFAKAKRLQTGAPLSTGPIIDGDIIMEINPAIFREYDIRGVYEKDFDNDFAYQLGQSFVCFLKEKGKESPTVTIGYDARLSSPPISDSLIAGIMDSGGHVVFLGLITTPVSYFSMFHLEADGGIMVTGSHNPPDYNGYKISCGKSTIFGDEIQQLRRIMEKGEFLKGTGSKKEYDIFTPYVERYKKEFSGLEDVSVVLDCGNGAAGAIARRLYEAIGLKPEILFEEFIFKQFVNYTGDVSLSNIIHQKRLFPEILGDRVNVDELIRRGRYWIENNDEFCKLIKTLDQTKTLVEGESINIAEYMASVIKEESNV